MIDLASRRIVGWATAAHLGISLAADALKAACHQRQPQGPVVFHSDRGSQYTGQTTAAPARRSPLPARSRSPGPRRRP
ncbi:MULTISPECIES: DDE-type integrase/transposase/recombinase [unclassified Streptomyces]|uniref:DDE-type integrase/transposase/recombinase n=1 Tax=Streptomyces sp. NRRL F-4428 TaxID=1609137 RepID=UPI003B6399C8